MNEYDELLGADTNEYDDILRKDRDQSQLGARSSLFGAIESNPEDFAKAKKLERKTGLPATIIQGNLPEVQKRQTLNEYEAFLDEHPTLLKQYQDQGFAKLAVDDREKLGTIEQGLRYLGNATTNTLAGIRSLSSGLWGTSAMISDIVGEKLLGQNGPLGNPVSRFTFGMAEHEAQRAQQLREFNQKQETMTPVERAVYSGFESLGSNLVTMPWILGTAGAPTAELIKQGASRGQVMWGLVKPMLPIFAQTTGQEYVKAKKAGLDTNTASSYAILQGTTEVATEWIPVFKFLEDMGAGTPFLKMLAKQIVAENIGEQVATLSQDMTEWRFLHPDKTMDDFIAERPSAALDTLISTMVTVTGQTSVVRTASNLVERRARAEMAKAQNERFVKIMEAAKDSKLRERDPQSFAQFVDSAAEASGADIQDVYIDARTLVEMLNQAGLDEARVNDLLPSMKDQLSDAMRSGGDVRFSVGELLATLPGSEIEQTLIPHIRLSADGLSLAEADVYLQSEAKVLKEQADKALSEAQMDEPTKASSEAVFQNILGQLTQANRFTADVNEAYAKLVQSFYTTMAARMGVTPEEVFQKHGLTVSAEIPGVPYLPQAADESTIVNPVTGTPEEKVQQLVELSKENEPIVADLMKRIDERFGTVSKSSFKQPDRILAKASRPSIKAAKPWFGVEHVRDAFRFKTVLKDIRDLPAIVSELRSMGVEIVKPDTAKVLRPKEWGWRIAAFDLRMPNGQIVEYYLPIEEQEAAKKEKNHEIFEKWRNLDLSKLTPEQTREFEADLQESRDRYQAGWDAYLARSGATEAEIEEALAMALTSAGSVTGSNESFSSSTENAIPSTQAPSTSDLALPSSSTITREPSGTLETSISATSTAIVSQQMLSQGPVKQWIDLQPMPGVSRNPLSQNVQKEGAKGAQGRLTRALSRAENVGGPGNPRTVLQSEGSTYVLGEITPRDWLDRVERNLSPEELKNAREWYGSLHALMADIFGKQNAERYSLAWLLSQQNTSPSGGMMNVLRAADMVRGMPKVKTAGLNERGLVQALRGEVPEGGYDAKLLDFIDSEMQRPVRAVMGDDPRGGGPAVIDVWANRDVGKVDQVLHNWLIRTFGQEAVANVQVDSAAGISETEYEYGSKFYNKVTDWLNEQNYDGGNWKPYEVQAVGWVAMQKQTGATPEFPQDIVDKNTRRVSFGLAPGAGTEFAGAGEVSVPAVMRILDSAATLAGVRIREAQEGKGSYLGEFESAVQVDVLGSPEAFQDFAAIAGYALRQTEVIIARPKKSGDVQGVTLTQAGGAEFSDPAQVEAFMARVRARLPEGSTIADGYQMVTVDGKPALRMYRGVWNEAAGRVKWGGKWKTKEFAAFEAAVEESANEQGIGIEFDVGQYEVVSEYNDWNANPDGQGYRDSLAQRGRDALIERLGDNELRLLPNEVRPTPVGRAFGEYAQSPVQSDGVSEADGGAGAAGTGGRLRVRGFHYSDRKRVRLDASRYGSGMRGAESARVSNSPDARLQQRIYFYVDDGSGVTPETGVGYHAHTVELDNLYDGATDPLGLSKGRSANEFESAVLDAGFSGYVAKFGKQRAAVLLGPNAVDVEYVGMGAIQPGQYDQENRGGYAPSRLNIVLLKSADLSTFLHETGHHFLEVMSKLAQEEGATPGIQADFQSLLSWFGIKDAATWNRLDVNLRRPFHEKFAESFEQFLFEGKSPNPELQGLFNRFRSWLTNVYQSLQEFLRRYNTGLTDEVRQVMSRMLATDQQIRAAETAREMVPLFKDAAAAGMSEDEWIAYQMDAQEATEAAMDQLQKRSMADMRFASKARSATLKRLQAEVKEKREAVRAEVEGEVRQRQVYQTYLFLSRGELAEGNRSATQRKLLDSIAGMKSKLDLPALRELYGDGPAAPWRYLPQGRWGVVAAQDGAPPALVAELFGYGSVDHMVRDLLAAPKMDDVIDAETDVRMLERYGDLNNPDVLARAADEAIHNEVRTRFVATELRALARGLKQREDTGRTDAKGRRITEDRMTRGAKEAMEAAISRRKLRDIRPSDLMAAETRSARAAEEAVKSGDTLAAIVHKRNQLLHLHGARFALRAVEEVSKSVDYLKKFGNEGTRKNLDVDYLDQIDAMLERFDLRTGQSLKAIDKRTALKSWIEAQEAQGFEPTIDDKLRDEAYRTHFRNMTLEEFRGLVDAVRNIEHLGRLKKKLLTLQDEREFGAVADEIAASIENNARQIIPQNIEETGLDRIKRGIDSFFTMHRKVASLVRQMDGFREGPFWNAFVRSMNNAANQEASMREAATVALTDMFRPLLAGEKMSKKTYVPEVNLSLSREARLSVALNWGNEQNRQRVMDGFGWNEQQAEAVLDTLTQEEWNFVQGVWDYLDTYWADISAKERRVSGVTPERVVASPVKTKFGTLRGGYYPIKYNPRLSDVAESHDAAEVAKNMLRGAYTRSTTRRGHTQSRVDSVKGRPIELSFSTLTGHLNQVIHDLSWHEWLIDAGRIVRDRRISDAIRLHHGDNVLAEFKKLLPDIAAGEVAAANWFEAAVNHVRVGATITGLGFNLVTSLMQPLGFTQSAVRLGAGWLGKGVISFLGTPSHMSQKVDEVYAKSEMMRLRGKTMQREINEIRNKISSRYSVPESMYFYMISKMQQVVDVPTWLGAYEKEMKASGNESRAVSIADQTVLDTQAGGQIKDLARIQRGTPLMKLWTNFYSFFSTTYNIAAERTRQTNFKNPVEVGLLAVDYMLLTVVPATLGALIKHALKGDDDDELLRNIISENLSYLFGLIIGLRELTFGVQKAFGVNQYSGSYGGPAGLRFLDAMDKLGQQAGQGEMDAAFWKSLNNVGGMVFHYPAGQINKTVAGAFALAEGDTQNPGVLLVGP